MKWIKTHRKHTVALIGIALIWSGLVLLSSLPVVLILTGSLTVIGAGIAAFPNDY